MPHFTRGGIYPNYRETRRFRWSVEWGCLRKEIAFGVSLRHGLTDGSGQFGRVDILTAKWGPFFAEVCLWWKARKSPTRTKIRSYSEIRGQT